ncbi:unnamed protein product [Phytophthora lilii]|uniref:Unnamed protein product n=1 Tax=Phytophthora lilii TaxID=2077276 RepID=A0A9W6THX4_9STRA|nr:unnamed protein product [Phytophthora lilii]
MQIAPAGCTTVTCLEDGCADAYQYPSDDGKTHSCSDSASTTLTFCLGGSKQFDHDHINYHHNISTYDGCPDDGGTNASANNNGSSSDCRSDGSTNTGTDDRYSGPDHCRSNTTANNSAGDCRTRAAAPETGAPVTDAPTSQPTTAAPTPESTTEAPTSTPTTAAPTSAPMPTATAQVFMFTIPTETPVSEEPLATPTPTPTQAPSSSWKGSGSSSMSSSSSVPRVSEWKHYHVPSGRQHDGANGSRHDNLHEVDRKHAHISRPKRQDCDYGDGWHTCQHNCSGDGESCGGCTNVSESAIGQAEMTHVCVGHSELPCKTANVLHRFDSGLDGYAWWSYLVALKCWESIECHIFRRAFEDEILVAATASSLVDASQKLQ